MSDYSKINIDNQHSGENPNKISLVKCERLVLLPETLVQAPVATAPILLFIIINYCPVTFR